MEKEYYLTTTDENDKLIVYESEKFRFSEMEILKLIRICITEERSMTIGKKIMEVFIDSNDETYVYQKLNMIGVKKHEEQRPKFIKRHGTK